MLAQVCTMRQAGMSTMIATVWLLMALITSLPPHLAHSQTPRPGHKSTWQVEATCLVLIFLVFNLRVWGLVLRVRRSVRGRVRRPSWAVAAA